MDDGGFERAAEAVCKNEGWTSPRLVGQGAFKRTFRVEAGDQPRALKIYKPSCSKDRTEREIAAMLRCTHPNIARFERLGTLDLDGTPITWTIEEFLAGGTLTSRIATYRGNRDAARALGSSLIAAVTHVAAHKLVHRDLKPDNIMFRESGELVVVDFGLVRDLAETSLTRTWMMQGPGTPLFAPPEQLNNNKHLIDWRADQFAIAVVVAIAATGQHPYGAAGLRPDQIVEAVAQRAGPADWFVRWSQSELPALTKMAAPWPVGRYRTPSELADSWDQMEG